MKLYTYIMDMDMTYNEVEAITGISSTALRVKVSRMRKKMRTLIIDIMKG